MDLATFIRQRRPEWGRLEEILERVEGSGLGSLDDEEAVEFGRLYRRAASDLNQAQTFVSGDLTVQYLNDLVARCYVVIHARPRTDLWGLFWHFVWDYPAVFRRHFGYFLLATVFVVAGTLFGAVATYCEPELARRYLMPPNFPSIEPEQEGEDRTPAMTTGELTGLSSLYFTNNVSVSLIVFALGITFGIGTAWKLFETGLMLGVLGVVFAQAGQFMSFCAEVLPHGVLEIPAVLIAGAGGFLLAEAVIRARPWPRLEGLARRGKEALLLVSGCVPLLAFAAVLEAGVARAPEWFLGSGLKLAVAGVFALLFAAYVLLLGWGKHAAPAGRAA
jgi:uncharacterized membrane protein SpoIIM required for sporulation